jgi:6-phosphogluconolactonase
MSTAFVYVSQAQDGDIGVWRLDRRSGVLVAVGRNAAGKNVMPMAVSPDRRHLYAVLRSEPNTVATFAIDTATGALSRAGTAPLPDSMPYVTVDATGRWLLTASYGGDKIAVNPIAASGIAEGGAQQVLPTARNAHAIILDRTNRFAYVPTLGGDCVMQFAFDAATGKLMPLEPPQVEAASGDGPRHLVTSPDNRFLYVLCELTGDLLQFAIDPTSGKLTLASRTATVPPEAGLIAGKPRGGALHPDAARMIWCADIAITPDGRHLYTTERTQSRIAQLRLDPAGGQPRLVTTSPTARQPRGIRIDSQGQYLVASGETSDHIAVSRVDASTGALTEIGRHACGKGANWVEIVDAG